ncbi:MAG: hypothetical protein KBF22_02870 [Ottowia sp.]|nr:hypothetical protein [Ottowia sp.]
MSNEDAPAAQPPRFVPTLTEVVKTDAAPEPAQVPPAAAEAAANPAPAVPPAVGATEHAMATADELLARLGPDLDRLISEAIGRVLHEQMLGFNGRVQKAVADVVREAVAKSLVQGDSGARPLGENP